MGSQTYERRHPIIVNPAEIRVGDWMRDLGKLRQVESVETTDNSALHGATYSIRFSGGVDGDYATLTICEGVTAIVWRTHAEHAAHAEAVGRVAA